MFSPVAFWGINTKCKGNFNRYLYSYYLSQFSSTCFSSKTTCLFNIKYFKIFLPDLIMPSLENYGHQDCENLCSVQLVSAAISQVSVTISRTLPPYSWKEVQKLTSLKTFKSFHRLSPWLISVVCQKQWSLDEVYFMRW